MAPTRRKPIRRSNDEESTGAPADALFPDEEGVRGFAPETAHSPAEDAPLDAEEEPGDARRPRLSIVRALAVGLIVALVLVEAAFCAMRWGFDDASGIQGRWYVNGSQKTISITEEAIVLADDVAYEYAIDTGAKTLTYRFGIMEGQGRYRFSLDRSQLAITDGEFSFADTLMADISWIFEALLAQISGEPLAPGAGESTALLSRAPVLEGELSAEDAQAGEVGDSGEAGESADGPPAEGGVFVEGDQPAEGEAPVEPDASGDEAYSGGTLTVTDKLLVSDKPADS